MFILVCDYVNAISFKIYDSISKLNSFVIPGYHLTLPKEPYQSSKGRARGDRIANRVTYASKGKDPSNFAKIVHGIKKNYHKGLIKGTDDQ